MYRVKDHEWFEFNSSHNVKRFYSTDELMNSSNTDHNTDEKLANSEEGNRVFNYIIKTRLIHVAAFLPPV